MKFQCSVLAPLYLNIALIPKHHSLYIINYIIHFILNTSPSLHHNSVGKEIHLQCRRLQFDSWIGKICWRRNRLPISVFLGFPCGSAGKESACNVGDLGSIPGLGRSPGEGKGYPLHCSGLENSMDHIVCGVAESDTTERCSLHFTPSSLNQQHESRISEARQ